MIIRPAHRLLLAVVLLAAPGCVSRSGRLDPFPAKIGPLHPSAPTVGILRYTDKRENPDWVAYRLRSLPPPRVFFEEAALAAIQKQGMNGLIVTSGSETTPEEVAALAAEMGLDAVLSGEVTGCDLTKPPGIWWKDPVRSSCTIELVLLGPRGNVLYSTSGHGEGSVAMTWSGTADQIHQGFFDAVEKATSRRIYGAFAETVRRSVREAKGRKP